MNWRIPGLTAERAVLGFCVWQAVDLLTAWQHSPLDALGWLAFGIWLTPTLVSAFRLSLSGPKMCRSTYLAWMALLSCLVGMVTDTHFFKHCALAFACAAVTPPFRFWRIWLVASLAWMPLLGWLLAGLPWLVVVLVRLGVTAVASLVGWIGLAGNFRRITQ